METSFAKQLYQFYKAFEFRSLWEVEELFTSFQRQASEAAHGTGRLRGVLKLTNALSKIVALETGAQQCFTKKPHSTDKKMWTFDNIKQSAV